MGGERAAGSSLVAFVGSDRGSPFRWGTGKLVHDLVTRISASEHGFSTAEWGEGDRRQ